MYSSHHAAVGTAITVAGYTLAGLTGLVVSLPLAAVSHFAVDTLNEKPYGNLTVSAMWEAVPLAIFVVCAYLSGMPWLFLAGWVAGNLFDIIDKKLYLAMFFKKIKPWFFFHTVPPTINLDLKTTKLYAILSVLVYIALAVWVGVYL